MWRRNTIKAARDELRSTAQLEDDERIGLDGKTRRLPEKKPEAEEDDDEEDDDRFFEPSAEQKQKQKQKQFIENAKTAAKLHAYEGPISDEMEDAAAAVADAWVPPAGSNRKWTTRDKCRHDLIVRMMRLETRISELTAALNAKELQESRNWPADMTPKQVKRRDKYLSNIAGWQRELEQLYGEVTGCPSWRVEVTTKDGRRLGTGARFGTRSEAEYYNAHFAPDRLGDDYAAGEIIACENEKANVLIEGSSLRFNHGDCVLLEWHETADQGRGVEQSL